MKTVLLTAVSLVAAPMCVLAHRVEIKLDGTWSIADGRDPEVLPRSYSRSVPVPGLANLAEPPFADVDQFESREMIVRQAQEDKVPLTEQLPVVGRPKQDRTYFWYRRTFRAPDRHAVARLKVSKAQFGTVVWLNGKRIGEHWSCFTAGHFDVTRAVRWSAENEIVIRIGAHPAAMPEGVQPGWTRKSTGGLPGSTTA